MFLPGEESQAWLSPLSTIALMCLFAWWRVCKPCALQKSEDGYELTWAVNVMAPFLLTSLLLDNITSRIVNVSSISAGSSLDFNNLQQVKICSAGQSPHKSVISGLWDSKGSELLDSIWRVSQKSSILIFFWNWSSIPRQGKRRTSTAKYDLQHYPPADRAD